MKAGEGKAVVNSPFFGRWGAKFMPKFAD